MLLKSDDLPICAEFEKKKCFSRYAFLDFPNMQSIRHYLDSTLDSVYWLILETLISPTRAHPRTLLPILAENVKYFSY